MKRITSGCSLRRVLLGLLLGAAGLAPAAPAPAAGVELLLSAFLAAAERDYRDQLPGAVAKTISERFPAASVLTFSRNHRSGVLCYDVVLRQLERRTRVEVAADGSVGEIQSRLSLETLPPDQQAMILAATDDGDLRSIDTHLRLGLARGGTFVLLDEPIGFHSVRYQRAAEERTRKVKVLFRGDQALAAMTAGGRVPGR